MLIEHATHWVAATQNIVPFNVNQNDIDLMLQIICCIPIAHALMRHRFSYRKQRYNCAGRDYSASWGEGFDTNCNPAVNF